MVPAQAWITLFVGLVGFGGVSVGVLQRTYADRRAEWWRRTTWAVDHTLSDDPGAQLVGYDVLARLQASRLVVAADRTLFAHWIAVSTFRSMDTLAHPADTGHSKEGEP